MESIAKKRKIDPSQGEEDGIPTLSKSNLEGISHIHTSSIANPSLTSIALLVALRSSYVKHTLTAVVEENESVSEIRIVWYDCPH